MVARGADAGTAVRAGWAGAAGPYCGAVVTFVDMSPVQARAFLGQFLAQDAERLDGLRSRVVADGAAREGDLDLGATSLDLVWGWATPRLSWRAGYEPPPPGRRGPREPVGALEPPDALPEWFDARYYDSWRLSATTLWVVDGVARYLAQCLLAAVPGSRWVVGRSRRRGYVYQNHPVVAGLPLGDDFEPVASTMVLVGQALAGDASSGRGPSSPRDVLEIWSGARPV